MVKLLSLLVLQLLMASACAGGGETVARTDADGPANRAQATRMPSAAETRPQATSSAPPSPTPPPTSTMAAARPANVLRFHADDDRFVYDGRFDFSDPQQPAFDWSATRLSFRFTGTGVTVFLADGRNSYNVTVDGVLQVLNTEMGKEAYELASCLRYGEHTVTISKRTEAYVGAAVFKGIEIIGEDMLAPPPVADRFIEFIGDSITTGYGNEGNSPGCWFTPETQNAAATYAALTAGRFGARYTLIALSGLGVVRNLRDGDGVSPETAIDYVGRAMGMNPGSQWPVEKDPPDAVVVNLGTNDYSSAPFPDADRFVQGYVDLLKSVRERYPEAHIFAVAGPLMLEPAPQMIREATSSFRRDYEDERVVDVVIEDRLERSEEDFGCDWHPNASGHGKIAAQLAPIVGRTMGWDEY